MSTVSFTFEGTEVHGQQGESIAAALNAAGIIEFRETRNGDKRGMFCGMGVCQECLVEVDGKSTVRACMTKLDRPVAVRRRVFARPLEHAGSGQPARLIESVPEERCEILVVGAGPAGLSAAIAARAAGAQVVLLDERSVPGGQYYKQLQSTAEQTAGPDKQHLAGRRLIDRALAVGVDIRSGAEVWGAFGPSELAATIDGRIRRFRPQRLIVATGAYERGVPFHGWTHPGVVTTGAAQTLWRSYRRLIGKRVLIAGNGPLNLQVASELKAGGATIVGVVEQAAMPFGNALVPLARMALAAPGLFWDGLTYRARLAGVPVVYGAGITGIRRDNGALHTIVEGDADRKSTSRAFVSDAVCLGYGFEPSDQILRALGCRHEFDAQRGQFAAIRDDDGRTSIPEIFAAGDCTGLGGAKVALSEGQIVGAAAAADLGYRTKAISIASARRSTAKHRRFQSALWRLYSAPARDIEEAEPETVLCRCEDVRVTDVLAALRDGSPSIGDLKRLTRAGMGACQGRYCGPILARLVATKLGKPLNEDVRFAPRMPIKPITIADIARGLDD